MPTIIGRLTGASFQTELLVMNLLGLVNSLRKWELGWANHIDAIKSSKRLNQIVKIILCWVVKLRIIIADIYTVTYLANFYSILTWCRERTLFPWMIVSAFDNFLLEFIGFSITLLLWLETSISSALFIEYMIARAIPRVPAFYYWCIINLFRADLRENQRRKLALASRSAKTSDSADRIRFGVTFHGKDYFEKLPRFASLTNLDDFSLYSSTFKYDDEQDYYKRSRSLVTFLSIDSDQSDETEDYHALKIFDDDSLTPIEKAMKILKVNDEDINEARQRIKENVFPDSLEVEKVTEVNSKFGLMENVFPGSSNIEKVMEVDSKSGVTENIIPDSSKVEKVTDVDSNYKVTENVFPDSSKVEIVTKTNRRPDSRSENLGRSVSSAAQNNETQTEKLQEKSLNKDSKSKRDFNVKNVYQLTRGKDTIEDQQNDESVSQEVSEMTFKSSRSSCICGNKEKGSTSPVVSEFDDELEDFYNKNRTYENDDSSRDTNNINTSSETEKDETTVIKLSFLSTDRSDFTKKFAQSQNCFATDEPAVLPLEIVQVPARIMPLKIMQVSTEIMPLKMMEVPADDSPVWSPRVSKLTQTKTDHWSFARFLKVSIDRKTSKNSKPLFSISNNQKARTTRTPKSIGDREAREMRALRAYNKFTLLEDKREMEAKKRRATCSNRPRFQDLICELNLKDPKIFKQARPEMYKELNQEQKRQASSMSPRETLKLSSLRSNLDALQMSISLGFSDNRTRVRFQKDSVIGEQLQSNNTASKANKNNQKPSLKYSQPTRYQDDQSGPSILTTRIKRIPIAMANRLDNVSSGISGISSSLDIAGISGILPSPDNAQTQVTNITSRIRETIGSLNWSFHNRDSDDDIHVSRQDNTDWNCSNVLWDILDDTNTVTLLQSAFSSNPHNTTRGFQLNPGSTELYSVSSYLDNVVEEIMKTAKLSVYSYPGDRSTTEIDYGDDYLEEFEMTSFSKTEDSSGDTLSDSDDETTGNGLCENERYVMMDPLEICGNGYSVEGLETGLNRLRKKEMEEAIDDELFWDLKELSLKQILSDEQEFANLENWTKELKKLVHPDHRNNSLEMANCIQHLTDLPGYCVIKMVVDFFRNFQSVSRSTMTSRTNLISDGTVASISTAIDQSSMGPRWPSDLDNLGASNIESSSQVRSLDALREDPQQPLKIDATSDSYDSLYSVTGNSRHSDNGISIGGHSSMEEFSRNSLNATESHH